MPLGIIGVDVFFVISGYLILQSWTFDARVAAFLVKRCLRIFPGLLGALLFAALVVGPLATTHTLFNYFADPQTAGFVGTGMLLYRPDSTLPGVFQANPFNPTVNGSLWTLPYEFTFYLMVPYLGRLLTWRSGKPLTVGLVVALVALHPLGGASQSSLFLFLVTGDLLNFATFFAVGMALFACRDHVPLRGGACLLLGAVWTASWLTPLAGIVTALTLPYLVIYVALGLHYGLPKLTERGDISYGVYIYAFPIEQLAAHFLGGRVSPIYVMLIALPITVTLASLSWRLIERRCLGLKRLLNGASRAGIGASLVAQE